MIPASVLSGMVERHTELVTLIGQINDRIEELHIEMSRQQCTLDLMRAYLAQLAASNPNGPKLPF
jgi:hypothetical protein